MDKEYSKLVFKDLNIPIVPYQVYEDKLNIPFPVIVKPANGGSSIGITKANNEKEFKKAVKIAKNYNQKIIIIIPTKYNITFFTFPPMILTLFSSYLISFFLF